MYFEGGGTEKRKEISKNPLKGMRKIKRIQSQWDAGQGDHSLASRAALTKYAFLQECTTDGSVGRGTYLSIRIAAKILGVPHTNDRF